MCNIFLIMNIEINLEDVCLTLLIVRKQVYNCNRFFKAITYYSIQYI
jgi:hypothetical protein